MNISLLLKVVSAVLFVAAIFVPDHRLIAGGLAAFVISGLV